MWTLLFDFDIAHRAIVGEIATVLGRRMGYLPNLTLIRVLQAGHNTVVFSSGMIHKLASANGLLTKTLTS
jgi:hypothetical protein